MGNHGISKIWRALLSGKPVNSHYVKVILGYKTDIDITTLLNQFHKAGLVIKAKLPGAFVISPIWDKSSMFEATPTKDKLNSKKGNIKWNSSIECKIGTGTTPHKDDLCVVVVNSGKTLAPKIITKVIDELHRREARIYTCDTYDVKDNYKPTKSQTKPLSKIGSEKSKVVYTTNEPLTTNITGDTDIEQHGYNYVWQSLLFKTDGVRPKTITDIRTGVYSLTKKIDVNIRSAVVCFYNAGLLDKEPALEKYSINKAFRHSMLFESISFSDVKYDSEVCLSLYPFSINNGDIVVNLNSDRSMDGDPRVIVDYEILTDRVDYCHCKTESISDYDVNNNNSNDIQTSNTNSGLNSRDAIKKIVVEELGSQVKDCIKSLDAHLDTIDAEIDEKVAKAVEAKAPTVIEIIQPDKPAIKIEGAHYLFSRLLKLVANGFHVFMWGPPGTGKTTAALKVAEALSRKVEIDTLDQTTARSMVQGYMTPTGKPVHTVFTRCWEKGQVYVADEVDLAPGNIQTLFNSALANDQAPLAWGNITKASDFGFIATGNTSGRPTAAFPDRRPMSNAFADRLYFIHWPLDSTIETRAVGLPNPELPADDTETCNPQDWVRYVQSMRAWAKNNAPAISVTPRASLLGIGALAIGESPSQVADALIFKGADSELKNKALRNIKW